jgi:hypothetical protein
VGDGESTPEKYIAKAETTTEKPKITEVEMGVVGEEFGGTLVESVECVGLEGGSVV